MIVLDSILHNKRASRYGMPFYYMIEVIRQGYRRGGFYPSLIILADVGSMKGGVETRPYRYWIGNAGM